MKTIKKKMLDAHEVKQALLEYIALSEREVYEFGDLVVDVGKSDEVFAVGIKVEQQD